MRIDISKPVNDFLPDDNNDNDDDIHRFLHMKQSTHFINEIYIIYLYECIFTSMRSLCFFLDK